MFAKINHVAIVSEKYALLGRFYQAVFGMATSSKMRPARALTVRDGYVGLNINPRRAGRPAGLDHFGIEVEDVETAYDRMRKRYPDADWVQRPSTRPFAGISANDPDGNVFDISQRDMANRTDIYLENDGKEAPRHISHVALRTLHPEATAQFYADVFDLVPQNKAPDDANYYLSDGRMTLVVMPWRIKNYFGQSILPRGMDHFGFTVDNMAKFQEDLDEVIGINPLLNPMPVGKGKEGGARLDLLKKQCPMGQYFMADPDHTMIAVRERD